MNPLSSNYLKNFAFNNRSKPENTTIWRRDNDKTINNILNNEN